jgi:peptide/nickel transport system ATP-binding protein/oligopeptide transport system ATP-binding protein
MNAGRVVETGSAQAIFTQPQDPYTRRLLAASQLVGAAA